MSETNAEDGTSTRFCDDRADEQNGPLEDIDSFEKALEEEALNETLSEGIDEESHDVGRIYRAQASANIDTEIKDDGSKKITESNDLTPHWVDQGYYRCHTCGIDIRSKVIAFVHASEQAPDLAENLLPAIRANISELSSLDQFDSDTSE